MAYETMKNNVINFIDLFSGIGGFRKAFEDLGCKCIFSCEINKFCRKTYEANFSLNHPFAEDIQKVNTQNIPSHDILCAGFPCQPFSLAGVSKKKSLGKKHGLECEQQGNLFFDIVRIIKEKKPKVILLENVKNLVSHNKGTTFSIIQTELIKLGYHISYKIIDAKCFVPQHRERVFIVGFLDNHFFDWSNILYPKKFPKLEDILEEEVEEKYTLSNKLWTYLKNHAEKHKRKGNGFSFGLTSPKKISRTLSARYHKDGSEILIEQINKNPRRLTPRECARLMGFDEDFRIICSDTQAYKQFGNSVVVPVVKAIGKVIIRELNRLHANKLEYFMNEEKMINSYLLA